MNNYGQITIPFADRCKEYIDAGIPLKPTTLKTIRIEETRGIMPTTHQLYSCPSLGAKASGVMLYNIHEFFILN